MYLTNFLIFLLSRTLATTQSPPILLLSLPISEHIAANPASMILSSNICPAIFAKYSLMVKPVSIFVSAKYLVTPAATSLLSSSPSPISLVWLYWARVASFASTDTYGFLRAQKQSPS